MPIQAIISQPGSSITPNILPAYRPVMFRVKATRTDGSPVPPVVFCDIYFNDQFYKSLSATQYVQLNSDSTEWLFDISSACKEYLRRDLPQNGGSVILTADRFVAKVQCLFRSSGYDVSNFITPEDVAPVQGTGSLAPQSGSGTASETFLVANATLQHADNQDLLTHLRYAIKNGSFDASAYPLTHRPSPYRICKGDSDYFPFIYLGNGPFMKICLSYKLKGSSNFVQTCYNIPQVCNSAIQNVVAVLQDNNDALVSFASTGDASTFQYQISGGSWLSVPSNPFTIKFQQFLMYLITQAGEQIILDQTGNIIVPQDVVVFDTDHALTIRPTCANGIAGATGSTNINIPSIPVCSPPLRFSYNRIADGKIYFDVNLPDNHTDMQMQWKMDYGNNVVTPFNNVVDFTLLAGQTQVGFDIPAGYQNGTFIFNARTKCSATSFSQWSPDERVPFVPVFTNVNLTLIAIRNTNDGNYYVDVQLSQAVGDDITVRGYYSADGQGGIPHTFGFVIVIAAGQVSATGSTPGAPPNGAADLITARIETVSPNPTSDAKKIIF